MDVSAGVCAEGGVDSAEAEALEVEVASAVGIEPGVAAVSVAAWIIGDVG